MSCRYMEPGVIAILGGVLPFGSIFIEMYVFPIVILYAFVLSHSFVDIVMHVLFAFKLYCSNNNSTYSVKLLHLFT